MTIESELEDHKITEVVEMWKQGDKFEEDGYKDLGFTLKENAIAKAMKLASEARRVIADILFPIK